MPVSVFDMQSLQHLWSTDELRAIFSEENRVQQWLDFEAALAEAQAELGIIPAAAAARIRAQAAVANIDIAAMSAEIRRIKHSLVPALKQLQAHCGPDHGEWLHYGATTQDVVDTGVALQLKQAHAVFMRDLAAIGRELARLAQSHRDTPMAGRTHLQHALPITFGYKAAVWLLMLRRHRERLAQLRPRVLIGQFGGAAGTLASLGDQGLAVHGALMRELGLGAAPVTWHVARDGLAETVQFLALVCGSLGKIAVDIMLMMTNELGEAFEPFVKGRGASSTMPQKRNPISCELMWAASKTVRQHAGLALDAMLQDFERATGPWHIEWSAVPEAFVLTAGSLRQARFMLGGLEVDAPRMARNLDLSGGLIVAEAVMMGLAPHIGRQTAHDVVYDACRAAATSRRRLADVLREDARVAQRLGADQIERLCDPAHYLGAAPQMVDRMRAHLKPGAA